MALVALSRPGLDFAMAAQAVLMQSDFGFLHLNVFDFLAVAVAAGFP